MRVGSYQQFINMQSNVNRLQQDIGNKQLQLTSGKKFNRPSESPLEAKTSQVISQALERINQYEKNLNDARSIMETTETTLMNVYNVLDTINSELLKAANGTYNQNDMETMANVITKSIESVVSLANTKHLNRYIFSGEKILTKPFDFNGNAIQYNGNDNEMEIEVSSYSNMKVIDSGNSILTGLINDLIVARDQVAQMDRTGIQTSIETMKTNMDDLMIQVSDLGVRMQRVDTIKGGYQEQKLNLEVKRSNVEDVDFTELMVEYSTSQAAYAASLKATSMMFQTSILDYI